MEEISIDTNSEIPATHYFVYKEKQYPFNFDLFKIFSQYFNSNQPKGNSINLFDEDINISEDSIHDFISFCHVQKIALTNENAPSLHKLSQKFKVPSLFNKTKEYISTHQKEVVVEMMSMYHNDDNFQLGEYEEIISKDLINYVHDDRLLTLPIPILYRIVTKYATNFNSNSNNSEQPSELIEFLFKCLDHFGCAASVLFEHIDLLGSGGSVINRLFDGYSEKFDFHFVNAGNAKTVYRLEGEIIAREKAMQRQIAESQHEVTSVSQMVREEIEKMKKQNEDEVKAKNEMIEKISLIVAQEIEKMKKQHDDEMKEKNEMIERLMRQLQEMQAEHQKELRRQHEEFAESIKQVNAKLDQLKYKKISRLFSDESNLNGVLAILGEEVSLTAGDYCSSYPLPSIRKYDNSLFSNWGKCIPICESDGYIMFDFGPSKKIDIKSYFIRSNGDSPSSNYHPKTWRIEGSNNGLSWTKLDSRLNNESLNGKFKQCHFICQFASYGSESNWFRYIKYVQEDSWYSYKYVINISYFELYGTVIGI